MIFNFARQTPESLNADIDQLLEAAVDQVTYYPLMSSTKTRALVQKTLGPIPADREREFYEIITQRLVPPYRFSSAWCFSRKAALIDEYLVNYDDYAGLGSGSIGYLHGTCYANTFSIRDYIDRVNRGEIPLKAIRVFAVADQARYAFLMEFFGLHLDRPSLRRKYGKAFDGSVSQMLLALRLVGAVRRADREACLQLTPQGRYYWVVLMREYFTAVNNLRSYFSNNSLFEYSVIPLLQLFRLRSPMDDKQKTLLKSLPKIDEVLVLLEKRGSLERAPREKVLESIRDVVAGIRSAILAGSWDAASVPSNESAADSVAARIERLHEYSLRRVINATGIILHTNLGRAPLCKEALARIVEVSRGYSNVEFDLASGKRGLRYYHIREILCELTGAEDALVVNNNAAAVLLVLSTLARGREAIVSRGELIEIGGEFRIPEVMERSGAVLREVGATNRTHLSDYEKAVNENTALIMKVHTCNFRIVGFTEGVPVPELVALGAVTGSP